MYGIIPNLVAFSRWENRALSTKLFPHLIFRELCLLRNCCEILGRNSKRLKRHWLTKYSYTSFERIANQSNSRIEANCTGRFNTLGYLLVPYWIHACFLQDAVEKLESYEEGCDNLEKEINQLPEEFTGDSPGLSASIISTKTKVTSLRTKAEKMKQQLKLSETASISHQVELVRAFVFCRITNMCLLTICTYVISDWA